MIASGGEAQTSLPGRGRDMAKYTRTVKGNKYETTEYKMSSTYKVLCQKEYTEESDDGEHWSRVSEKVVELARRCVYAD